MTVTEIRLNPLQGGGQSIGIFDSGLGGLTVLKEIVKQLPQYDYTYLGDNARAPYGTRSFETVYRYTLECVQKLFSLGCPLVILACNTASAKALRNIQQLDLPLIAPNKRVLGVIRPTAEVAGKFSKTKHIGVLGTPGTINSDSYKIELEKFSPEVRVFQEPCPLWVPIVENNGIDLTASDTVIKHNIDSLLSKSKKIDTIILGCTHYPLLIERIKKHVPPSLTLLSQGGIVAESLANYLKRHSEIENKCSKSGNIVFYTTDSIENFDRSAGIFWGTKIKSKHLSL